MQGVFLTSKERRLLNSNAGLCFLRPEACEQGRGEELRMGDVEVRGCSLIHAQADYGLSLESPLLGLCKFNDGKRPRSVNGEKMTHGVV